MEKELFDLRIGAGVVSGAGAISRRSLVLGIAGAATWVACGAAESPAPRASQGARAPDLRENLAEIERKVGGKLGVAAVDTRGGATIHFREEERFPFCSTFKMVLAGAVLARVDEGKERLDRSIPFAEDALLDYAPTTRAHVHEGAMRVEALCEAAVVVSDNTAANLLLDTVGGPAGLTAYFRSLGDGVSRLDRNEPTLNTSIPGDPRDTTTPEAMLIMMKRLLLGDALSAPSRERLVGWMEACSTGRERLRAGLPGGWRAGDKTGTGMNGATNDVAIAWPPGRPPILLAVYTLGSDAPQARLNAALGEVAAAVAKYFVGS
jgi:beta-lactamase class A